MLETTLAVAAVATVTTPTASSNAPQTRNSIHTTLHFRVKFGAVERSQSIVKTAFSFQLSSDATTKWFDSFPKRQVYIVVISCVCVRHTIACVCFNVKITCMCLCVCIYICVEWSRQTTQVIAEGRVLILQKK